MKTKRLFATLLSAVLTAIVVTSCSDDEQPSEPVQQNDKYCLMFYVSGGDEAHDKSFFQTIECAAEATTDNVAVTCLMKTSSEGENPNQVGFYIGENGELQKDESYSAPDGFSIVDPKNLTDFITRSRDEFPGRKYILVYVGHGSPFNISYDLSDEAISITRSTLYDDGKMMAASVMAKGIADAGVHLQAMIANSCLQGSIEHFAEWEGLADYLLCSPFAIPDVGYDYATMINDIDTGSTLEQALSNTAERAIHAW